ncbi:hypothetical protein CRG98_018892, partial [Punica granatum]
ACPSRVPGKVDTPKPRCIGIAHACPDEMKFYKGRLARPPARTSTEPANTQGPHRPVIERGWCIFRDNMIDLINTRFDHREVVERRRTRRPTTSEGALPNSCHDAEMRSGARLSERRPGEVYQSWSSPFLQSEPISSSRANRPSNTNFPLIPRNRLYHCMVEHMSLYATSTSISTIERAISASCEHASTFCMHTPSARSHDAYQASSIP